MLKVVLLLFGLASARLVAPGALAANRTTTAEDYWQQWGKFQKDHDKTYNTKAHHDERFNIFIDNIDKINTHNAKKLSWTLGVNQFADLTAEEFKAATACMMQSHPRQENPKLLDTSSVPTSVDWEAQGKVTAVKNQGQCGSCWAFSTTGSVEARVAIANNADPVSLSEQELVDCSGSEGNNGCNGGLMDYGFEYIEKEHGLCTEASYPYKAKTQKLKCSSRRKACTHVDSISSYQDVSSNSETQLEAAVAQGPVSIAIEADQSAFQLYHSGVFSGRCGKQLDHGVLVVGYGTMNGEEFWKVKNSWGASWGSEGYIYLCRDCGKNGSAGQCGLLGQPSYPVV